MYWGQVALAATAAMGSGWLALERGHEIITAALVAVIAYVGVRWTIAWLYRVRYWLRRGTRGHYSRSCPSCGQYIYRRSGDWILQCGRCGWTAGLPGVRWLTQSVPARQLRRTVVGPKLLVVIVAGALVLSGATAGMTVEGALNSSGVPTDPIDLPTDTPTPPEEHRQTAINQPTAETEHDLSYSKYNFSRVEALFIEMLNRERASRGLQNVTQWSVLSKMGKNHSLNMVHHSYMGHVQPDGDDIQDRYRQRNLLPECELDIKGTDRYYPGAENVAKTHIGVDVIADWADGGSYYIDSERDLAWALFQMWMHSKPHRKAMLVHSADRAGLGISIGEDGVVYAALELC